MRLVQHIFRWIDAPSLQGERGTALVELAVVMPLVVLLLVGAIDFARVFYTALAVTQAARAGAEYGALYGASSTNASALSAAMILAAQNAVQSDIGTVSVPAAGTECQCVPDNPGNAGALDGLTVVACTSGGGNPTGCSGQRHLATFATVTATKTFTMTAAFPGLPYSMPITRTARLRVK